MENTTQDHSAIPPLDKCRHL